MDWYGRLLLAVFAGAALLLLAFAYAGAHEHMAGETAEQARVVDFLRTWMRPKGNFAINHRVAGCCYGPGGDVMLQDCFPVKQAKQENGVLWVKPDDPQGISGPERWYPVNTGVEEDKQPDPRESPDGRSYVCISGGQVICFVAGSGT